MNLREEKKFSSFLLSNIKIFINFIFYIYTKTYFYKIMSKSLTINTAPMLGTNNVLTSVSDNNPGLRMNAVLYIPQSLSPEQQAQARANIGAAEGNEVPTKVSQLDNDMDYTTQSTVNTLLLPKADSDNVYTKNESDNRFEPLYTPEYITDTNIL
jgi:hypothetical protein